MDTALAAAYEAWELFGALRGSSFQQGGFVGNQATMWECMGEATDDGKKSEGVSGTNEDTEAPRGEVSCSRSHHEYMVEPEFEPKLSGSSLPS